MKPESSPGDSANSDKGFLFLEIRTPSHRRCALLRGQGACRKPTSLWALKLDGPVCWSRDTNTPDKMKRADKLAGKDNDTHLFTDGIKDYVCNGSLRLMFPVLCAL